MVLTADGTILFVSKNILHCLGFNQVSINTIYSFTRFASWRYSEEKEGKNDYNKL